MMYSEKGIFDRFVRLRPESVPCRPYTTGQGIQQNELQNRYFFFFAIHLRVAGDVYGRVVVLYEQI